MPSLPDRIALLLWLMHGTCALRGWAHATCHRTQACLAGVLRSACMGALCVLAGCQLPPPEHGPQLEPLPIAHSESTRLGQAVQRLRGTQDTSLSGIHLLHEPRDAFAARALLARAADRTLDVQYYIWRSDKTGQMLLAELIDAADRGVRVRLLLDDMGTSGLDADLLALHAHPQIEVRLFNPFALRTPKFLCFVTDFARANRRMHNKSFTADRQATIVGGRNVGNEYFGATDGVLFADLDVLALGTAARETASDFDRYWSSPAAYPVAQLIKPAQGLQDMGLAALRQRLQALRHTPASLDFRQAVVQSPFMAQLLRAELPVHWVPTRLVSDDPAKIWGQAPQPTLIAQQIAQALGTPQRQLDLVSPYFVPTQAGADALMQLQRNGVQVRVLTNALESTDVAVVHAGYAKYRKMLLRAGITLYEKRHRNPRQPHEDDDPLKLRSLGPLGSSGTSLHAKTFAVDGQRLFVGSFNFDPRSAALNTEQGLVMDSPVLTAQVSGIFTQQVPQQAYRLELSEDNTLRWHALNLQESVTYEREPYSSLWLRMALTVLGWLPIEWLL